MTETFISVIMLDNVRLDRVSLVQPYIGQDAPIDPATGKKIGKYHVDVIFGADHPQFPKVQEIIRAVAERKWKELAPAILQQIAPINKQFCLQRGDVWRPGKPAYAGKLYISASNKEQPTVVVTEGNTNIATRGTLPILTPAHKDFPYSGSYANVQLRFFAYERGGNGISAEVLGVQFLRHGVRTGGSSLSAASEFGLVPADADAAAPTAVTGSAGLI